MVNTLKGKDGTYENKNVDQPNPKLGQVTTQMFKVLEDLKSNIQQLGKVNNATLKIPSPVCSVRISKSTVSSYSSNCEESFEKLLSKKNTPSVEQFMKSSACNVIAKQPTVVYLQPQTAQQTPFNKQHAVFQNLNRNQNNRTVPSEFAALANLCEAKTKPEGSTQRNRSPSPQQTKAQNAKQRASDSSPHQLRSKSGSGKSKTSIEKKLKAEPSRTQTQANKQNSKKLQKQRQQQKVYKSESHVETVTKGVRERARRNTDPGRNKVVKSTPPQNTISKRLFPKRKEIVTAQMRFPGRNESLTSQTRVPKRNDSLTSQTRIPKRNESVSSQMKREGGLMLRYKASASRSLGRRSSGSSRTSSVSGYSSRSSTPPLSLNLRRRTSQYHTKCTKLPRHRPGELIIKQPQIPEELRKIKEIVDRAVAERKTFTVSGNYYTIRRALLNRGWVEKMRISYNSSKTIRRLNCACMQELLDGLKDKEISWLCRRVIISRLLATHQVDFYWDYSNNVFKNNPDTKKFTIINRLRTGIFGYSSKSGLCETTKRAHWHLIPGRSQLNHPRTYNFCRAGDPHKFLEDYKQTAAMSVLKWVVERSKNTVNRVISDNGKVPLKVFEFAVIECKKFIMVCKHKDVDMKIDSPSDQQWHQFFESFYKLVHLSEHFKSDGKETAESMVLKSEIVLAKIRKFFPYLEMDGIMNIWILKPVNGCRGIGIHLCRTLEYILTVIKNNNDRKYIIQKYVERPLLIYSTKFDIRQWFLISNTSPLTIWIYSECYVRFSSQTFNIRKLHESIHLTNNSVQSRYKSTNRDPSLPKCNMWDLKRFKSYLEKIGHPEAFNNIIYPGMKQNILCAVLANQDNICKRKNSYELYGSDFLITEDFKPWLLEINCRPALYASTPVTGKMCPKVLEDTVKIMIDVERNKLPNTSKFELIYREKQHNLPKFDPSSLVIKTIPLKRNYFIKPEDIHLSINKNKSSDEMDEADLHIVKIRHKMKETLEHLLKIIKDEKNRRMALSTKAMNNVQTKQFQKEVDTLNSAMNDVTLILNLDEINRTGKAKAPLKCQLGSTHNDSNDDETDPVAIQERAKRRLTMFTDFFKTLRGKPDDSSTGQ